MQFLLLICLMMACLPIDWPPPEYGLTVRESLAWTGALIGALVVAAWAITRIALGRLRRRPEAREAIAHFYGTARTWFFFANLGAFVVSLFVLGWGWTVTELATIDFKGRHILAPGAELLNLAPFVLAQIGSWFVFYDVDRRFLSTSSAAKENGRFWTRGGYVFFLFRQQLIVVLAPLVLLVSQQGIERMYPEVFRTEWLPIISVLTLPAFLLIFPLFLPPLLGLKPLPAGPLRDRLTANARRLHFRYSQIYLWDTRGGVANAMIVGIIPWIRYVIFTDRLFEDLQDAEVDAVLGHEIGHARHGHLVYYALFLTLSFIVLGALIQSLRLDEGSRWREHRTLEIVAPIALMGVYMFSAFGFISRRCERQADVFGCRAVSCGSPDCGGHDESTVLPELGRGLCRTGIATFVRGLDRVMEVNGLTQTQTRWRGTSVVGKLSWIFHLLTGWLHTWQHSTIQKRIAFLRRIANEPTVEQRFQRRLYRLRWAIVIGLIGTLVALVAWRGWNLLLLPL